MTEPVVSELVALLTLERLEDNLFRGQSRDIGTKYVFGGQVLGQALSAAQQTVEEGRSVHSIHAYFLRAGDITAPIIFDVDYRPYSWPSAKEAKKVLSRAGAMSQVIIGNDEEFGFMAGDIAKGLDKARALASSSVEIVVYKLGAEGSVAFFGGQEIRTGIFPVNAIKPTGAGDSFMAGFMASIAEGRPMREAVLRGSACASIVVAKSGCAPAMPSLPELEAFLASHPGATAFSKE